MKVWIHINGIQEGPFMLENLPFDRMDANTPVWYNGLPDWMPACQAPEVARMMAINGMPHPASESQEFAPAPENPKNAPVPENMENAPAHEAGETGGNAADQEPATEPMAEEKRPQLPPEQQPDNMKQPQPNGWQQPQQQGNFQQPHQQGYPQPHQQGWPQPQPAYQQSGYQPWRVPVGPDGRPLPCPPNYLVWSILLTVLCCNPVGIVAIVCGAGVKSKFYSGNIEGARRASETTAWWVAISIVTGLIMSCCMGFII